MLPRPGARGVPDDYEAEPRGQLLFQQGVGDRDAECDITGLVQEWVNDPLYNNGLIIHCSSPGNVEYYLRSKEYAEGPKRP